MPIDPKNIGTTAEARLWQKIGDLQRQLANLGTQTYNLRSTAARAHRAGGGTLTAATWTFISLDTIDFDPAGCVQSGAYTAPVSGPYQVNGAISFTAGATTVGGAAIAKNGTVLGSIVSWGSQSAAYASGAAVVLPVSDIIQLNKGDFVALMAYNNAGTGTLATSSINNYLSAARVT